MSVQPSPSSKKSEFVITAEFEKQKSAWLLHLKNVHRDMIRYRKIFGVPYLRYEMWC